MFKSILGGLKGSDEVSKENSPIESPLVYETPQIIPGFHLILTVSAIGLPHLTRRSNF